MQGRARRFGWLLSAALVASCGGGANGGGASAPVALADLGARVDDVLCALSVKCGDFPDMATCQAANVDDLSQTQADVAAGKVVYDGAMAAACLDAVAAQTCDHSSDVETVAACDGAFEGTVAAGAACTSPQQCASKFCDTSACDPTATCCAGTCAPLTVVAVGGSCATAPAQCAPGSFCRQGTCVARVAAGRTCAASFECAVGLACTVAIGSATGTCGPYPATGANCAVTGGECNSEGDFCDSSTNKCTKRLAVGAPCAPADDGCVSYAICDPGLSKCVALVAAGGACTGDECLGALLCTNGTCALPAPATVCK